AGFSHLLRVGRHHAPAQSRQSSMHVHGHLLLHTVDAQEVTRTSMKSISAALLLCALSVAARADEGQWLYIQPPRQLLKDRYQFDATDTWLEHLQKSSVRFNSGGSGSFLSERGLLISNHHVGADALQKFST